MQNLKNKKQAVVIFSGGQDSTTCLFWAKARYEEVIAISFDYGQKHKNCLLYTSPSPRDTR